MTTRDVNRGTWRENQMLKKTGVTGQRRKGSKRVPNKAQATAASPRH